MKIVIKLNTLKKGKIKINKAKKKKISSAKVLDLFLSYQIQLLGVFNHLLLFP
jgi:ABC-type proline/glycine betaine transport system ATPase subunit